MQRVIKNWKSPLEFSPLTGEFKLNGNGRRYLSLDNIPYRDEAFNSFGFKDLIDEPVFKNFIGEHYLDSAFTHEHQDKAPEGFMHVRVNWMINKPKMGGDPIINGKIIQVTEGDLWICFASEELHSSTPTKEGIRRICSFGALIQKPNNFNIKEIFK